MDFIAAGVAIRGLHARYIDAVWRKDYDAFGDCLARDAEWRIGGPDRRGRPAIVEAIEKIPASSRCVLKRHVRRCADRGAQGPAIAVLRQERAGGA